MVISSNSLTSTSIDIIIDTSPIENEPKTINIHQMHQAREMALHVLKTRSKDDALKIFTEGLAPGQLRLDKATQKVNEWWGDGADQWDYYSREWNHGPNYHLMAKERVGNHVCFTGKKAFSAPF